ncbi:hypothetical protein [Limnobacter sp.]|uniref:hypothetical protein n=1 Tax=Limnobacter sp. TaxID=2003368 RepID=UPI003BAD1355
MSDETKRETKKCPHCAEEVLKEASVCKHCHQPILTEGKTKNAVVSLVLYVVMFFVLFYAFQAFTEHEAEKQMKKLEQMYK